MKYEITYHQYNYRPTFYQYNYSPTFVCVYPCHLGQFTYYTWQDADCAIIMK